MSELTLLLLATKFTSSLSVEFFHQWHKPGKKWFCAGLYKLLSSVMNSATTNMFPFKRKREGFTRSGCQNTSDLSHMKL